MHFLKSRLYEDKYLVFGVRISVGSKLAGDGANGDSSEESAGGVEF